MLNTHDSSRTLDVGERLARIEAELESRVKRCTGDLARLLADLDIESLRYLCKSTRLAWPSLLRLRVCKNEVPLNLVGELVGAMNLGIVAGQQVVRDERQRLGAEHRQRAKDYVAAIALRRNLTAILTVGGIEVVYEDLCNALIDVSPRITDPALLAFVQELRAGTERAGLDIPLANSTSARGTTAVATVSPPAKYRRVLLARAFRGLCVQLFAHCAELLHEAGPFLDAMPDHTAILEAMLERLEWFASQTDLPTPPSEEQRVEQELAVYRFALQSHRSELQNISETLVKTHNELQMRLATAPEEVEEAAKAAIQDVTRMVWDMERRAEMTWREIVETLPDELREQMRKSMIEMQQAMRPTPTETGAERRAAPTARELLAAAGSLTDAQVRDHEFFRQKREELLGTHAGQFVAIRDGSILGFAPDLPRIHELVQEALGPDARVFISDVTPEAFEEESETLIYMG